MFNVLIFWVVCSDFEKSVRFWVFVRFYRDSIWNTYRIDTQKKMVLAILLFKILLFLSIEILFLFLSLIFCNPEQF